MASHLGRQGVTIKKKHWETWEVLNFLLGCVVATWIFAINYYVCALLLFYNNSSYKRKYIRKILIFLKVNDETKIGRYKPRTDGTERTKWKSWKWKTAFEIKNLMHRINCRLWAKEFMNWVLRSLYRKKQIKFAAGKCGEIARIHGV